MSSRPSEMKPAVCSDGMNASMPAWRSASVAPAGAVPALSIASATPNVDPMESVAAA